MCNMMRVMQRVWLVTPFFCASGARADEPKVTVVVQPHKSVIALGEPLLVLATVTNRGSEVLKLVNHNAPTFVGDKLSVVDLRFGVALERLNRWDDGLRELGKTKPSELAPGRTTQVDLLMSFNRETGFFTSEPGKYWIQGRVVISPAPYLELLSEPVSIEVRAPGPEDRETWDWINANKEEYGRMVQVPWEAELSDEFVRECAKRCEPSPSPYAEYLALFLSRSYQEGPRKNPVEAARFAEIAKARASSERVRVEADRVLEKSRPQGTKP